MLIDELGHMLGFQMARHQRRAEELGERIARTRKATGMTQTQLAQAIGLSQGLLSLYERGVSEPAANVVARIACALGVSADELLGIRPGKPFNEMDADTRTLWRRFQKLRLLPERDQRAVVRLLQSLVKARAPRETSTGPPSS
jgi:transcriptional regulator with XRE-family HTH domain